MRFEPPRPRYEIYRPPAPAPWQPNPFWQAPPPPKETGVWLHVLLFAVTFVTTAMAGAFQAGADPLSDPMSIRAGFPFAVTLLSILLIHELGHYSLARYHHVRASLPYFIPAPPFLIGTFGAFIRMKSPPPDRRSLFDVGAAGPWAGLLVAIPAVILGLQLSEVRPLGLDEGGMVLGDSLLFTFLSELAIGKSPDEATILLHPVALAGWFGLFVTFLNLIPAGQLDGGHVAYALFGRAHRFLARACVVTIACLGFVGWQGWFTWVVLLLVIGVEHPPTYDPVTPLDWRRRLAAWMTFAVLAATFMPAPFSFQEPSPMFEGERTEVLWRPHRKPRLRFVVPFRTHTRTKGVPT